MNAIITLRTEVCLSYPTAAYARQHC